MTRNLKALGVALGVVFAIGAVTASTASATDLITTSVSPAVITASNTNANVLKITKADGGALAETKCATTKYAGTATSGANEITVSATAFGTKAEPNNPSCETSLGNAKVEFNSCDYDLTGETIKKDPTDATKGTVNDAAVSITCKTVGDEIKIVAPASCTITIPAQTPTEGGLVYAAGEELVGGVKIKDLTIDRTITGITFTSTAACQLVGIPKEANTIDFVGTITATCWKDEGAISNDEFTEGSACNLSTS